jgi:hypothetical protein
MYLYSTVFRFLHPFKVLVNFVAFGEGENVLQCSRKFDNISEKLFSVFIAIKFTIPYECVTKLFLRL